MVLDKLRRRNQQYNKVNPHYKLKVPKKSLVRLTLIIFLVAQFYGVALISPKELDSAGTLTSAKDTLSNSRLSYHAKVSGAHSAGATTITIGADGPDANTNHLFPGDTIKIGNGANATKTVGTIIDTTHFTITAGLGAALLDDDPVIATQSAIHTVSFTTNAAVANGAVRIKIPSATSNNNDGLPDQTGFDFNSIAAANLSCPAEAGDLDFVTPTASASGANGCPSGYSCFECRFSGTLPASTAKTFTIGNTSKKLINPSPKSGHSQGTADTYSTIIDVLNGSDNVIDTITVKTAIIESVFVSATVDSTLSFSVALQEASETHCGQTTSVPTTISTVPFDTLTAATFYDAAQTLTVSTNADSGYAVTIEEDDQMSKDGGTTEIPDSGGDDNTATHIVRANWVTATATLSGAYGLGYSLDNISGTDAAFSHDDFQTHLIKQLPCTSAAGTCGTQDTAQTIMSNAGPVSGSQIDVCYRINISGTQEAGYYYNKVMYIATPVF